MFWKEKSKIWKHLFLRTGVTFQSNLKKILVHKFQKALTWGLSEGTCWGSPSAGWKRISRHRAFQKGVSLLRTKSRDNMGTASAVDWSPNGLGRVNSFRELTAHFYSLKIKEIPTGRLLSGDWLGRYRCLLEWASLPNLESGSLLVMIRGLLATVTKGLN